METSKKIKRGSSLFVCLFILVSGVLYAQNPVEDTEGKSGNYFAVWKELSGREKLLVFFHPFKSWKALKNKDMAIDAAVRLFGVNGTGDISDAFRHSFWTALNTQSGGQRFSVKLGDAHEYGTVCRFYSRADVYMDIHNNAVGVETMLENPAITQDELIRLLLDRITAGDMLMLCPDKNGGFFNELYTTDDNDYRNPLSFDDPFIRRAKTAEKIIRYLQK